MKLSYGIRAKDLGIRSFVVSNSDYRKRIQDTVLEIHEKKPKTKKGVHAIYLANGIVRYKGEWIQKKLALKRIAREKRKK
jgi:hypothetical protein